MPRKPLPSLSMTFSDCFKKEDQLALGPSVKEEEMMSLTDPHQPRMPAGVAWMGMCRAPTRAAGLRFVRAARPRAASSSISVIAADPLRDTRHRRASGSRLRPRPGGPHR
jgi:hypothetical protein